MQLVDVLSVERVSVATDAEGPVGDKAAALERLATMLASGAGNLAADRVLSVLVERERLQSTGVGGGVAVPHGSLDSIHRQVGALLLCPQPIAFDAIDGEPVAILFALIGPKGTPADHLRVLARVSRLLCSESFRERLVRSKDGREAYELIAAGDQGER